MRCEREWDEYRPAELAFFLGEELAREHQAHLRVIGGELECPFETDERARGDGAAAAMVGQIVVIERRGMVAVRLIGLREPCPRDRELAGIVLGALKDRPALVQ